MKNKWRVMILALCVAMIFGLVGCAPKATVESPAPGEEAPAEPESPEEPASGEKVHITYSCWGTVEENEAVQNNIDTFNASQDRIEVEIMLIPWENYVTQLNTLASAGNLPDSATLKEEMVKPWVEKDMLVDVSSMYSDENKPLDCITFKDSDGNPVAYGTAGNIIVMYYNKDMFDAADLPYPPGELDEAWTWDEFVSTAKQLTLDSNGNHPDDADFDDQSIVQYGALVENLAWQLEWPVLSNGGGFFSEDGNTLTIGEPEAIEAIQKVADLYLVDKVAPLSVGVTDDGVQRGLIAGTVAMTTNGTWNVGTCLNTAKEERLNYGVALLPKMKESATVSTAGTNVVFKQSEHQEEAMEWIKWNTSIENAWPLVIQGILHPTFEKYYTDETFTHQWLDNPNFPPYDEYKVAAVDPVLNTDYTHPTAWMYTSNTNIVYPLLENILGDVWTGNTTAEEAITSNLDQLQAAFEGNE